MREPARTRRWAALLAALTLAVYAQAVRFDFVGYDDPTYVTLNPEVSGGLSAEGVVWAFTDRTQVNWHPLTWLSHMLDVSLFGLDPAGHHATNVALHLANTLLLYALLLWMTGATLRSVAVAALFAVHPLHVESVAWVSERKDVLSTCFGLLSLLAYVRWTRRGGAGRYALCAGALAAGLMAKPMLVTWPFVLLLLDRWPLGRLSPQRAGAGEALRLLGRRVAEKLPLFALSAASCVVTWRYQHGGGATAPAAGVPLTERLANAVVAYAQYLGRAVWPTRLSVHYPHPSLPAYGGVPLGAGEIAGALALLAVVSGLALALRRRPYLAVGWLWFLGTLVPVIGIVQVGTQALADRYTYVPLIGVFVMTVWGGADLVAGLRWRGPQRALASAGAAWILLLALGAFDQARVWRDSLSLFERSLAVLPESPTLHLGMGNAERERGELKAAMDHWRRALAVNPELAEAHANLGNALLALGRGEEALAHHGEALLLEPEHAENHVNLANSLAATGRLEAAEDRYRHALAIDPDLAEAHYGLANARFAAGDPAAAVDHYRSALALRPDFVRAHSGLANALGAQGDLQGAIVHFRRALALQPNYPRARQGLERAMRLAQGPAAPR